MSGLVVHVSDCSEWLSYPAGWGWSPVSELTPAAAPLCSLCCSLPADVSSATPHTPLPPEPAPDTEHSHSATHLLTVVRSHRWIHHLADIESVWVHSESEYLSGNRSHVSVCTASNNPSHKTAHNHKWNKTNNNGKWTECVWHFSSLNHSTIQSALLYKPHSHSTFSITHHSYSVDNRQPMQKGEAGNQTNDPLVSVRSSLPPEPQDNNDNNNLYLWSIFLLH